MFTLGWDPSRNGFHAQVLVDEKKNVIDERKVKGLAAAYKVLLEFRTEASRCGSSMQVGFEEDNSIILEKLHEYGVENLYALIPRRVESYKAAASISDKDDFLDAYSCACFLVDWQPKLRAFEPLSDLTKKAKQVASQLDEIRTLKTETWERLWDLIDRVSPEVKRIIGDSRETHWFLQVLQMVERVKHTGFPGFQKFCRKHKAQMGAAQLRLLHTQLKLLQKEGLSVLIVPKAKMLQLLLEEKKHWEQLAGETLAGWQDAWILHSIKGVGAATQIRLVAYLGDDWSKWNPESISKYAGIAPRLWATGIPDEATLMRMPTNKRKRLSMHKGHRVACNKHLKTALCLFALYSLVDHPWAHAAYRRFRGQGQGHWEALRNLAIKWVRIFCALMEKKEAYDEYSHTTEINRRAHPLRAPPTL